MSAEHLKRTEYILRKTIAIFGAELDPRHPWVWEDDRWKELVVAIFVRVSGMDEEGVARNLVSSLDDLNLLEISTLARIARNGQGADESADRFVAFLIECGVPEIQARVSLDRLSMVANAIDTNFGGKIQRYLRRYGQLMIAELGDTFGDSAVDDEQLRQAFVYWLQNVLDMPISLMDEDVHAYCHAHHFAPAELFDAADSIDLNVGIVDDLAALWVKEMD